MEAIPRLRTLRRAGESSGYQGGSEKRYVPEDIEVSEGLRAPPTPRASVRRMVWDYFQMIKAPHKGFVWFENSGHFPFFEDQREFLDKLVQQVLPLSN